MNDGKSSTDKSAGGGRPASTQVKRPGGSVVRQEFSHGRSKTVVVEVKSRTAPKPAPAAAAKPAAPATPAGAPKPAPAAPVAHSTAIPNLAARPGAKPAAASAAAPRPQTGMVLRELTAEEKNAREGALAAARAAEQEQRRRAAEEAKRRQEEEARLAEEREAAARRKADEDERRAAEERAARLVQEGLRAREEGREPPRETRPLSAPRPAPPAQPPSQHMRGPERPKDRDAPPSAPSPVAATLPAARRPGVAVEEDEEGARRRASHGGKPAAAPKAPPARAKLDDKRRTGKLNVVTALNEDERVRSVASFRRHTQRAMRAQHGIKEQLPPQKIIREVIIPEAITVQELANRMATRSVDIIKTLMKQGQMVTINTTLDADTAQLIAEEFGHAVKRVAESDVLEGLSGADDAGEDLQARAPVVTVMGHVDHGKTSLLDSLRSTDVAAGEAGGITQHIGAYQVAIPSGDKVTFLDTPGHAAFTSMRARGAKVTDIVILVVAADDGVMPQTVEAINHAKAAKVPIIVAINKIDKPDANPSRVKTDLLQHEIVVEDMGGETQAVEVSAIKRTGLDKLLEAIMLQAEILELRANPKRAATGAIIEAKLDRGRGPVATVLIQKGTIRVGDIVVAGSEWGRVRALLSDKGEVVTEAGPSVPVEVLGLSAPPDAGDELAVVESEARAREVADFRARKKREARSTGGARASLDQIMANQAQGQAKVLPLLVKSDVQGSVEAIVAALNNLSTSEVKAQVLHSGVGGVTQSDVILARANNAPIMAFNVRANAEARDMAKRDSVEIRYYSIIYNIIDDVRAAMSGLLAPTVKENFLGYAEILEVFNISKVGKVAGCRVTEGKVLRGNKVRLLRDNVVIHEGSLSTLKRFKDEVKEVVSGQECGMAFENYQDLQKGDQIECFELETVQRSL
jgi:translation initiation factor IF-2